MKEPDWSKCQIYKIVCKDLAVKDLYVGSTCSWSRRKSSHKKSIIDTTNEAYNYKKAVVIRENGGWDNWEMVLIEDYPCETREQAHKKERELTEKLGATMNVFRAFVTPEEIKERDKLNQKKYREANKEAIKKMNNARYFRNKDL